MFCYEYHKIDAEMNLFGNFSTLNYIVLFAFIRFLLLLFYHYQLKSCIHSIFQCLVMKYVWESRKRLGTHSFQATALIADLAALEVVLLCESYRNVF